MLIFLEWWDAQLNLCIYYTNLIYQREMFLCVWLIVFGIAWCSAITESAGAEHIAVKQIVTAYQCAALNDWQSEHYGDKVMVCQPSLGKQTKYDLPFSYFIQRHTVLSFQYIATYHFWYYRTANKSFNPLIVIEFNSVLRANKDTYIIILFSPLSIEVYILLIGSGRVYNILDHIFNLSLFLSNDIPHTCVHDMFLLCGLYGDGEDRDIFNTLISCLVGYAVWPDIVM